MAQAVSYGSITIVDTNDIEEIYMIYAGSNSSDSMPTFTYAAVTGGTIWKRDASQITGDYIWQSTVVTKSGVEITGSNWTNFYEVPVCITGPDGLAAKEISTIETQYCNYGDGTPGSSANWQSSTPAYDATKPNYWTRTRLKYDDNTYSSWTAPVKNQALTDAIYNAYVANSIATHAQEDAEGALSQSTDALQRVQAKYGTSSTGASTVAKVANCEGFQLFNGAEIFISFTNKNTATNPTLNVNNTGAKPIKDSDGNALAEKFYWKDSSLVHFVYDGTNWRILDIVTTEKYNNLVSDINGVSQTVGQHTTQISGLGTRVSTAETNITQNTNAISLRATKTEAQEYADTAESNAKDYTDGEITTAKAEIKVTTDGISTEVSNKVGNNEVISKINQSAESITINANRVNIEGATIFTGSGRLSQTSLNNAYDIKGAAATAESNAISAAATDATNKANAAQTAAIASAAEDATTKANTVNNALEAYKTATNSTLNNLQNQVDGQVEVWYYSVDPTTSNVPASSWNTDELKARHEGDLYYNIENGHSWRWLKSGNTYSWQQIPDSDAAAALAKAQAAETLAGNKRRIFTSQPTPPYDVGDLWVTGSQIKYCQTSKTTGSYAATDWTLTATDDTTANSAAYEEQYVYISKTSGTTSVSKNETWVAESGDVQNTWTTKRPTYNTSYPVLFVAKQKKTVGQSSGNTCTCTTPVKDDTTTIIDGGHITTGTIDASKVTVTNLQASSIAVGSSNVAATLDTKASNSAEYEVVIKVNSINYTTSSATLMAIPTKLGAATTGSFIWYKNAIGTAHGGTVSTTTNTNDTLTVSDLEALYIAVLQ